jgi:hypothetical protein
MALILMTGNRRVHVIWCVIKLFSLLSATTRVWFNAKQTNTLIIVVISARRWL